MNMELYRLIIFLALTAIFTGLVSYKVAKISAEKMFIQYIREFNNAGENYMDICNNLELAYIEYKNKSEELNNSLFLQKILTDTLDEVEKVKT